SWTTLLHFAISSLMRAPNSSGILATGAKPNVSKRSLTSDVATAFAMSPRQRSMMSFGVPAGATMPVSVSLSRSGMPASALVGSDNTRDHIGRPAGPKGHDQSDRPCGISLRRGLAGGSQEREQRGDEYESTQSRRHGILP